MVEPSFIHLRVHSDYSIIDGLANIKSLVNKAVALNMPALAITDFTNLCGFIKFYKAAHSAGLKPIVGADFHVHSTSFGNEITQLTILAMNNIGYQNLILLISKAYQRGYGALGPWIDRDWLIKQNEGLLLLSGGRMGDVGRSLLQGNNKLVDRCLDFYQQYFYDRFYLELIRTGRPNEETYLHASVAIAEKRNIPVVATNDVRFIDRSDFDAHEIRVAIHDGFTLNDIKRPKKYSSQQYMRSEEEMCKLFIDVSEALKNSVEIAKRCNVTINLESYFLPQFPTGNITTENFLIKKSKEGLEERLNFLFPDAEERQKHRKKYDERLDIELKVINQMGFPGYFLIVMEFIQWSKDNGIPVGPGRGSGAGSLVSYALKITDLDPLEFNLLFERFLNLERISMPDLDIDFCMEKRDLVIDHVVDMYGYEAVSQIITFGTMTAKAVIRDVGRVLGYPYGFVNRISKLVPQDPGITLEEAFTIEPQLIELYDMDDEVKVLIDMARKLEGVIRNIGKHAGGVVIAPTKITDFTPLYYDETGKHPVTQFDKTDVECTGLVKFDFLGLRTLTIINGAVEMINNKRKRYGELPLDITTIPLNDKKSFKILQRSETTAVFQLESRGMKDLIKRLQPDCFEDIVALIALFRPGPLQSGMVDNFINRKHGREKIFYPDTQWYHESLKPILESTYGIILYQEQIMQIAQVLSGYTLGEADILRRAIGKKKPVEMAKQRIAFERGAIKNGINKELAVKIFDIVEKFASYGFNKSHSAAYALIAYQTLWLKTHYPAEFMSAAMTADMHNTEKVVGLIDECRRIGIKVLQPNINSGLYHFHVNNDGEIIYGIGAIKGIGEGLIKAVIEARNNGGYFRELFDFCARINIKKLNRLVLEKLIMSGAFDIFGSHRASLMNSLNDALKAAIQHDKDQKIGQKDMFGIITNEIKQIKTFYTTCHPWSEQTILDGEHKALGLHFTNHPINQYLKEIGHYVKGVRLKDVHIMERGKVTSVAGLVITTKIIPTKSGHHIGLCILDDSSGRLGVTLFTDTLNKFKSLLKINSILIVSGQIIFDNFSKELKMIARKVMDINEIRGKYARGLAISLTKNQINKDLLNKLHQFLKPHCSGVLPINIYYKMTNARIKLRFGSTWHISLSNNLLSDLRNLIGVEQVEVEFD